MLERLEKSGGLGGIWPSMVNSLMAMKCLGYEDGNPTVEKAIEDIEALAVYDEGYHVPAAVCVSCMGYAMGDYGAFKIRFA
jgi:squalene-hopene/tetraprenyl-beta-curcumene cyclase